jgi:acetyltransferase-like isoleucine patch superfamily enzyme
MKRVFGKLARVWRSLCARLAAASRGSLISNSVWVNLDPGASLVIGRNVRIMPRALISVAGGATLTLEDGAWIGPGVVIYCAQEIRIGASSRIAHYTTVVDHDYNYGASRRFEAPRRCAPVVIGANVWLGANVTVLKGVSIGEGAVVAAAAVVTKAVPASSVAFNAREMTVRPIVGTG